MLETEVKNNKSTSNIPSPDWLLNGYPEITWKLRIDVAGHNDSYYTVSWNWPLPSGLKTRSFNYWVKQAKRLVYYYMESDKTQCSRTSTLATMSREIRAMMIWFSVERKCISLSSINKNDIREYELYIKSLNIKYNTAYLKLCAVRLLWKLREEVQDGLTFDPYIKVNDMAKIAKSISVKNCHTPTIKPMDLFRIINYALAILDSSKFWINLQQEYLDISSGKPSVKFKRLTGVSSADLIHRLKLVYGSAIILTFCLEAMRKHELAEITIDDISQLLNKQYENLPLLYGRVSKTATTRTGKKTSRPVVKELEEALNIVKEITEPTRKLYGGNSLFVTVLPNSGKNKNDNFSKPLTSTQVYCLLNYFSAESGINLKLRPHMFRRAFALIYTWRYELGDLQFLSRMLYHNDIKHTLKYTNESDLESFLPEAEKQLSFEIMEKALSGNRVVDGGFGRRLKKWQRWLESTTELVRPERVAKFIENLIEREKLILIPSQHGYCVMSPKRAKHARCSEDGNGPDFVNRVHAHCLSCPNYLVHEGFRGYWGKQMNMHEQVFRSTNAIIMKKVAKQGIEQASKVLGWFNKRDDYCE